MRHALIMAGGSGTRLWPLSRQKRPKQLLPLFNGKSLLQIACERLRGIFEPENIWVITSAHYLDLVHEALPDIPRENLIGEPTGRDTANAIGLAAALLERRDPDATMAVFTADHIISPQDRFATAINAGLKAAEDHAEALITFGITPASPHTGYGYVRRGEALAANVYRVRRFEEKPARETAEAYVSSGEYYWNSGMFAWRVSAIQKQIKEHLPDNFAALRHIADNWGTPEADHQFGQLRKISIDFGVMEHAPQVLLVEMNCEWLDLGSWTAIAQTGMPDDADNIALAQQSLVVKGHNNIIVSEGEHLVVALGVRDLVIVHSEDATLVCHREHEQAIKALADDRKRHFGEQYE